MNRRQWVFSPMGASPYGCLDMAGNVWEWTRTIYKSYPYRADDGRENLESAEDVQRALRGGAFYNDQIYVRCTCRSWNYPGARDQINGFRVVALSSNSRYSKRNETTTSSILTERVGCTVAYAACHRQMLGEVINDQTSSDCEAYDLH